jgi:hypothetical protein
MGTHIQAMATAAASVTAWRLSSALAASVARQATPKASHAVPI